MKINVDIPTSLCFVTSNYCLIFTVEINLIIRSLGRLSVVTPECKRFTTVRIVLGCVRFIRVLRLGHLLILYISLVFVTIVTNYIVH